MALAFGLGAIAFFVGDWYIDRKGGGDRKDIAGNQGRRFRCSHLHWHTTG